MQNTQPITFYSFIVCPYAIRSRITLEELKIPYSYKEIDLLTNQHLSPEYLKINPMHKVPSIINQDGKIIYESLIICEYLDQDNVLTSNNRDIKAQINMWIKFYENNITTNKWNMMRYAKRGDTQKVQNYLKQIQNDLKILANRSGLTKKIKNNRETYFMGNFFSLADIGIIPLLLQDVIICKFLLNFDILYEKQQDSNFNGNQNQEDLEALKLWLNYSQERPSIQKSTYNIEQLPSWSEAPLLKELQINNRSDWDFEKYYTNFALKKFLNGQKPKL